MAKRPLLSKTRRFNLSLMLKAVDDFNSSPSQAQAYDVYRLFCNSIAGNWTFNPFKSLDKNLNVYQYWAARHVYYDYWREDRQSLTHRVPFSPEDISYLKSFLNPVDAFLEADENKEFIAVGVTNG